MHITDGDCSWRIKDSEEEIAEYSSIEVPKQSLLGEYLSGLVACKNNAASDRFPFKVVRDLPSDRRYFFSVITRTQGKRLPELKEALLCLSAQSDSDFSVCLVGHNISDEAVANITKLIESFSDAFSDRIALIVVDGGGRSRPLNAALEYVTSDYITILDDDDLVFDNWIESFRAAASCQAGYVICSNAYTQEWGKYNDSFGETFLTALGSPNATYFDGFDLAKQYGINHCPIMALAFPSFIFDECGFRFKEDLSTNEDWDLLMRASLVCGVHSTGDATSIYRIWKNAPNSTNSLNAEEWFKNEMRVIDDLRKLPLLLPPDIVDILVRASDVERESGRFIEADSAQAGFLPPPGKEVTLSLPSNVVFSGLRRLTRIEWDLPADSQNDIAIVLSEKGLFTLNNLTITLGYCAGSSTVDLYNIDTNGVVIDGRTVAFLSSYPKIFIPSRFFSSHPSSVSMSFTYVDAVNEDLLTGTKLVVKLKWKCHKLLHGLKYRLRRK